LGWSEKEGEREGFLFAGESSALLSMEVCMSPTWPAKKMLSKFKFNLKFWWFSLLMYPRCFGSG